MRARGKESSGAFDASMNIIELRNVRKTYRLGEVEVPVLRGVSLSVAQGEFIALMGASGSGKTTLMNILGCLDRPTSGEYRLEGRDVVNLSPDARALLRNQRIGFVFQTFNLLPRTSAADNVLMPRSYSGDQRSDQDRREQARKLMAQVGLEDRLQHEPSQLSGGEQQRVAIARALINHPSLLFADEPTGNLDSVTSQEILEIFRKLNDAGVTIILVTHDENVARVAKRTIRMQDGVVSTAGTPALASPGPGTATAPEACSRSVGGVAHLRDLLRTALGGLRRNVMRAALTTLGIIIGVAAVIAMMEIGRGSSTSIQSTIASMGANNLLVTPGTVSLSGAKSGAGTAMTLTPQDAEAISAECPAVKTVAPVVRARAQVVYGNQNWVPIYIYGTTPEYLDVREWSLAEGASFTDMDVRNAGKVCLIGATLARELFQGESPVGKEVRVQNVSFKVVGVLSGKGASMIGIDQDDILLAPWTTMKFRVIGSSLATVNQSTASSVTGQATTINQIYPSAKLDLYPLPSATQAMNTPLPVRFTNVDQILTAAQSTAEIPAAMGQMTQLLAERHRIRPGEPADFNIRDMMEITKALASTASMMTKLLLAVALISLAVGGVGIMNIMLVSVTERTREIGLRMAVGAWRRDILQQFLVESVILCFCGGVAGIFLGRGISFLIRTFLGWPTELSLEAIVAAFMVSVSVGLAFGYYPARKASLLDPIVALRYE
jgi:macrolide transport system ATP-binding/permease protein